MPEIIPNWHPIFVNFTVGLLATAVMLYLVALVLPERWAERTRLVARWNLWLGTAFTVLTVVTGLQAYNTVPHDGPAHAAMATHRNWALTTFVGFVILSVWVVYTRLLRNRRESGVFAAALVIGAVLLTVAGQRGAEVVFRHGVGVERLPDVDDHQHGAPVQADSPEEEDDHPH
ncbi:DUF2231 domain-containing protein [Alkalilimnicola ehrlichii]|nr:DUF2231 domain-containing protein [Alkalilimnicola ehrlichii]